MRAWSSVALLPRATLLLEGQLLLSLDDHLAAAGALNRRRLALHTQLQMGRETRKEAAVYVCRRVDPASDRKPRAGVAVQDVQPRGTALGAHGSHGRCYCDPLRCLLLSLRADAMKRRTRAVGEPLKARPCKALKRKGCCIPGPFIRWPDRGRAAHPRAG